MNYRKLLRNTEERYFKWLDKNWIDAYIEVFQKEIKDDSKKPSLMVECLPMDTFEKLLVMWDLKLDQPLRQSGNICKFEKEQREEEDKMVNEYIKNVARDILIRSEISEDLQVLPESTNLKRKYQSDFQTTLLKKKNPYRKFLKNLDQVNDTGTKGSNLSKKAGKITKTILDNFLKWYQSLGEAENDAMLDETSLHKLFEVGFDLPGAKLMTIRINEVPTIPDCLAVIKNEPKHAHRYALRKFLKQDMELENIPMKMFAFGSMLPKEKNLRFKPPRNFVHKTWMECSRVPKDLSTMQTVWSGLEKLRSTIAFSNWLKNHPEITPPVFLQKKGLLNINYEEWNQMFKGFEIDMNIENETLDEKLSSEMIFIKENMNDLNSTVKLESTESFM